MFILAQFTERIQNYMLSDSILENVVRSTTDLFYGANIEKYASYEAWISSRMRWSARSSGN